jgi:hypothetical protein
MRETRLSGSEGGGAGQPALPTPIVYSLTEQLRPPPARTCRSIISSTDAGSVGIHRLIFSAARKVLSYGGK